MTVERGGDGRGRRRRRRHGGIPATPLIFSMIFERAGAPLYVYRIGACISLRFAYMCTALSTPFGWVVDGRRCCAGDAIGGRAVTAGGWAEGGTVGSRRRKGVRVPLGGKRRWCNGVGGWHETGGQIENAG